MRISILILAILLTSLTALAQWQVAMIDDADGYVNVRSGQGIEFEVLGTLNSNDLFVVDDTFKSDWIKVLSIKRMKGPDGTSSAHLEGYMHVSRIRLFTGMPLVEQRTVLVDVLEDYLKYLYVSDSFMMAELSKITDSATFQDTIDYWSSMDASPAYFRYSISQVAFADYYCRSKDTAFLRFFIEVLWADRGSASEEPVFTIGECYLCEPDLVIAAIRKLPAEEKKTLIVEHIEWALQGIFYTKDSKLNENPQYTELMKKLESVWD